MTRTRSAIAFAACLLCFAGLAARAHAQGRASAAVLNTQVASDGLRDLGGAMERVTRARLDALGVVRIEGTPALDLAELQLAIGCVGQTDECYEAVASQLHVDLLIMGSVSRAGSETVAEIAVFDRRNGGNTQRVVRRATGQSAETRILDGVDGMLRELFGLPPARPGEITTLPETPGGVSPTGAAASSSHVDGGARASQGPSLVPFIVLGAGAAALTVGAIFGALSNGSESDYAAARTSTMAEVNHANELLDKAKSQALIANVFLVSGGAIMAAGALLLGVELWGGSETAQTRASSALVATPVLRPDGAGLILSGALGGAR